MASSEELARKSHTTSLERKSTTQRIKKYATLYLMFLPVFLGFLVFRYIPSIGAFSIPFTRYSIVDGFFGSEWVGFKWFIDFVKGPFFFRLLKNTILLGVYGLVFGFPMPILLALLLNEITNQGFKRVAQSVTYLPHFVSVVIIVGMIYSFFSFDGYVNRILVRVGLGPFHFLSDPRWFRPLYISSGIWQRIGWGSIIYLASLASINPELYESAYLDGANRFRRMIHVTLPGIAPTITVLLILNVSRIINVGFEKVFLMQNPSILSVSDVFSTYVYRRGILGMDYSYAAAVGLFNAVVGLILIVTANTISRLVSDNSLW
jgi:putative aldouronate transport system permease protein